MSWKPRGIRADEGRSYVGIEREAARFRKLLLPTLAPTEQVPGERAFELIADHSFVLLGKTITFDFHVQDMPTGVEAWTQYDPVRRQVVVTLSTSTHAALRRGEARARFSLFHEFGHAWLHGVELIRLSRIPHEEAALLRGKVGDYTPCWDTEWQADAFSAAFLMPAKGLAELERDLFLLNKVATTFGVSTQAAYYRIENFRARRNQLLAVQA